MASLRDSVKDYQEELRDGIAWVAFWKEGRSWNAELFHLEVDGTLEPFDRSRLEEIKAADPAAVILNGYYCGHLGEDMSLDELTAGVRYHYENSMNDLDGFIGAHDDRLPPEVIKEARAAAHAVGLPFSEKPYRDGEDFDPYVFDGSMSIEDYELMHRMIEKERSEQMDEWKTGYSSYDRDRLDAADKMKIERGIYFETKDADISPLTALPLAELMKLREESAAAEQTVFENLKVQASAWEEQAAKTLLFDKAIEYARIPEVKHTANKWQDEGNDRHTISNRVYKMSYHVYENTRYDKAAQKSIPYSYTLSWNVYTNSPHGYGQAKIAGQDRKVFADRAAMEKYLNGRIPIVKFLLGVSNIAVPWDTLILSVVLFVVIPLAGGMLTRSLIVKRKGKDYFENVFIHKFDSITTIGLLLTLVMIFSFQGNVILENPLHIVLIAIPLILQTFLIFAIAYVACRVLKLPYKIAAPAGMIGASNFFELAVAVAIALFGTTSPAALATTVGVLTEVPVMLLLVRIANKTKGRFPA